MVIVIVLGRWENLTLQIQASNVDLIAVADQYESPRKFFLAEREDFKYFEEKVN